MTPNSETLKHIVEDIKKNIEDLIPWMKHADTYAIQAFNSLLNHESGMFDNLSGSTKLFPTREMAEAYIKRCRPTRNGEPVKLDMKVVAVADYAAWKIGNYKQVIEHLEIQIADL